MFPLHSESNCKLKMQGPITVVILQERQGKVEIFALSSAVLISLLKHSSVSHEVKITCMKKTETPIVISV